MITSDCGGVNVCRNAAMKNYIIEFVGGTQGAGSRGGRWCGHGRGRGWGLTRSAWVVGDWKAEVRRGGLVEVGGDQVGVGAPDPTTAGAYSGWVLGRVGARRRWLRGVSEFTDIRHGFAVVLVWVRRGSWRLEEEEDEY
ncbi:hypothetical protein TIFTF001_034355 [Ficus carica]|uniref:Uncharacterized protein n=1 Tax=Ficus carica TaxID=3494 RepID=A0AA88J524_FICCA|nr:hypothetical protein TIFTF001_034355 [Ficus carica]